MCLNAINRELRPLEAWHIRLIAKVEEITTTRRATLAEFDEEVRAKIVQTAAEAYTPL